MIRAARIFAPTSSFRLVLIDAALMATVFGLLIRTGVFVNPVGFLWDDDGAPSVAALIAITIISMYFSGLYAQRRIESRIYLVQQLTFCAGVSLVSQALLSWIHDPWTLPRGLPLYGLPICILVLFCWRLLREALLSQLEGTGTVMILGTGETGRRIAQHIAANPAQHLKVAGSLTNNLVGAIPPVLGELADLCEVARRLRPDVIVSSLGDSRDVMPITEMLDLRYSGFRIEEAGTACELICRYVSAPDLRPSRMLFSSDFDAKDIPLSMLLTDSSLSVLLLIAGAPFVAVYWALMRISGAGRVFRVTRCAGMNGQPFLSRQLRVDDAGVAAAFARSAHLENWPQLWNVLMRRMSFVGPSPQRLGAAAELSGLLPIHEYRLNVRPGITGWARINLKETPGVIDAVQEVEHDLYYIRNQSFSLYTYILLRGLRAAE